MFQNTAEDSVSECQPASMGRRGKKTWTREKAGISVPWEENPNECVQGECGERESALSPMVSRLKDSQPVFLSVMTLSLKEPFYLKLQTLLIRFGRREKDSQLPHLECSCLQMRGVGVTFSFNKQLRDGTQNLNKCLIKCLEGRG